MNRLYVVYNKHCGHPLVAYADRLMCERVIRGMKPEFRPPLRVRVGGDADLLSIMRNDRCETCSFVGVA